MVLSRMVQPAPILTWTPLPPLRVITLRSTVTPEKPPPMAGQLAPAPEITLSRIDPPLRPTDTAHSLDPRIRLRTISKLLAKLSMYEPSRRLPLTVAVVRLSEIC